MEAQDTTEPMPANTETQPDQDASENVSGGIGAGVEKGWALPWMGDFLAALGQSPHVGMACKAAGVSRAVAYETRTRYADFAEAWVATRDYWVDRLETKAVSKALEGDTIMLIFLLKSLRPGEYSERLELRHTGEVAHKHGVVEGLEPREIDPAVRHEAVRLRLLGQGAVVDGAEGEAV